MNINKAQSDTLDKLHKLTGRTHQRLVTMISPYEIKVTLDDMVEGVIDENGEVSWKYTRGSLCDGCRYEFTPNIIKKLEEQDDKIYNDPEVIAKAEEAGRRNRLESEIRFTI